MATDPTGYAGPHPDLRPLFRDALEQMRAQMAEHPGPGTDQQGLPSETQSTDVTVRSQRTWHDIRVPDPTMSGVDLSAGIVQFSDGPKHYSFFIEAVRRPDSTDWQHAGISGGERPAGELDRAGGFMITGGQYVCVGRLRGKPGFVARLLQRLLRRKPFGHIEVEHADGMTYRASVEDDGGCIVFAPIVESVAADDQITVRYLDESGRVMTQDRTWIGNGGPPPAAMFAAMRS